MSEQTAQRCVLAALAMFFVVESWAADSSGLRAIDKSGLRAIDKSGLRAIDKSGLRAIDKSGLRAIDKSGLRAIDKSGLRAIDKSGLRAIDKSGLRAIDKSGLLAIDKSGLRAIDKSGLLAIDKSGLRAIDKSGLLAIDKSGLRAIDKSGLLAIDKSGLRAIDKSGLAAIDSTLVVAGLLTRLADNRASVLGQAFELDISQETYDSKFVAIYGYREIDGSITADDIEILTAPELQDFSYISGEVLDVDEASGIANISGVEVDYTALLGSGVDGLTLGESVAISGRFYNHGRARLVAE